MISGSDLTGKALNFFYDVHCVADNFFGAQGWRWVNADEQDPTRSAWQRFQDEMMQGAQFYSNDSYMEDRIALGTCAALYAIPYLLSRTIYDGALNTLEYGASRVNDQPFPNLDTRNLNGYVLGAPLSLPFIALMAVAEGAGRMSGISAYGKRIVNLAGKYAANISSHYTEAYFGTYDESSIQLDKDVIFSLPQSGWEVVDRVGLILPAITGAVVIGGAAAFTASAGLQEIILRMLGFSAYGRQIIQAASERAGKISGRYTECIFGPYDPSSVKKHEAVIFSLPDDIWGVADRVGLFTFPAIIAATEIAGAVVFTGIAGTIEIIRRMAGISAYGKHMGNAAVIRAVQISERYTGKFYAAHFGPYDDKAIEIHENEIFSLPKDIWGVADRMGFLTLPAVIAGTGLAATVALTGVAGIMEVICRMAGISDYGLKIIKAAGKRAANISKRYTWKYFGVYTEENIQQDEAVIFSLPQKGWEAADRVGLFTLPAIISALAIGGAVAFTASAGIQEIIARMLGLSAYGRHIIEAAGGVAAKITDRYLGWMWFDYPRNDEAIKKHEDKIFSLPKDIWGVADRVGFFTFPGVIAAVEIAGAVLFTSIAGTIETIGRILGISSYGGHIVKAAGKRAANMSKYTRAIFGTHTEDDIQSDENVIFSSPKNGWDVWGVMDRVGLFTFPGIIAVAEIGAAALFTGIAGTLDIIRRMAGFSNYSLNMVQAVGKRVANMCSRYTRYEFKTESIKQNDDVIFSPIKNGWDVVDMIGLALPIVVSVAEVALATAFVVTASIVESAGRLLGISERSLKGMSIVFSKCGNMFGKSDPAHLQSDMDAVKAPVKSWWDACDCIGTVVASIASVGVSIVLAPFALLGFSKSNYHRLNYYVQRMDNDIQERRQGMPVDRAKERYHHQALKEGEQTHLGKFFSKVNVLNVLGHAMYYTARFVIAPVIAGTLRTIKHLGGLVPIAKAIYRAVRPVTYNLAQPVDRVRKRFADLKKSLDGFGHLPQILNEKGGLDLNAALHHAEKRNILSHIGFSLFSEGRKIFSLGHTAEERVLAEFKNKFEEFVRAYKNKGERSEDIQVKGFFTSDNGLNKGERFSYDEMVKLIKGTFTSLDDRRAIDRIAQLLRADLECEMGNVSDAKESGVSLLN